MSATKGAQVFQFPARASNVEEPWRDKRWIASHYGFSVRWVEKMLAEGAPSELIRGRRRMKLSLFDQWLRSR